MGIITGLLTLYGLGMGTYAAGAGTRALWHSVTADCDEAFEEIPVKKHLYKNWLIRVEDASLHIPTGRYFTNIYCGLIGRKVYVEANTIEELHARIEHTVAELSVQVDDYNQRARSKA